MNELNHPKNKKKKKLVPLDFCSGSKNSLNDFDKLLISKNDIKFEEDEEETGDSIRFGMA